MRDSIDFENMDISELFRKLLIPTVLGMVFSAAFIITDGIFVGKGIGSDALAAINITAPIVMAAAGMGLMFGTGASVVASIHLSQGKQKVASINITQALVFSSLLILVLSAFCFYFIEPIGRMLGSSERLLPLVVEYMHWYMPFLVAYILLLAGSFYVRLDGAPNYAMLCNVVGAVVNIVLDFVFIFVLEWGMMGAALATSLGMLCGGVMTVVYLTGYSRNIGFYPIKFSRKSMMLARRNIGYMLKLGSSAFVNQASVALMMVLGNVVFIRYLGEDGVAAFSIACYIFPIVYMIYNATAQSALPIMSYNFGANSRERVREAFLLSMRTALTFGVLFTVLTALFKEDIITMFITPDCDTFDIAVKGLPLFAVGYAIFAFNVMGINYYQSVKQAHRATVITLLRSAVYMSVGFFALPSVLGVPGIWLAVPLADVLTSITISGIYFANRFSVRRKSVSL